MPMTIGPTNPPIEANVLINAMPLAAAGPLRNDEGKLKNGP